ncbi:14508_t:CDS:1, partial [Gigaspora rosea]
AKLEIALIMQATSLPNHPSILAQMFPRQQIDNNFLNIPSIITSPSIPTSTSESFPFNYQPEPLTSPISQAISAPVTPTNSVTPGFPSHPPRRKGNQNNNSNSNDGKVNGSK